MTRVWLLISGDSPQQGDDVYYVDEKTVTKTPNAFRAGKCWKGIESSTYCICDIDDQFLAPTSDGRRKLVLTLKS